MVKTAWSDLDRQGRGMAQIVEFCKTVIKKELKEENPDYDKIMGMIDRQIKAGHQQMQLTDLHLGIKVIRRLAEKKYLDVILQDKLKALV